MDKTIRDDYQTQTIPSGTAAPVQASASQVPEQQQIVSQRPVTPKATTVATTDLITPQAVLARLSQSQQLQQTQTIPSGTAAPVQASASQVTEQQQIVSQRPVTPKATTVATTDLITPQTVLARLSQSQQLQQTQIIPSGTAVPVQAAASQVTEQQIVSQRQVTPKATTIANLITPQAVLASLAQSQQLQQQVQLSKANLQPGTVTSVSLAKSLASGIMVNTPTISATATLAKLTKALGQAGVTSISTPGTAQNAAIAAAVSKATQRNHRAAAAVTAASSTLAVQEMMLTTARAAAIATLSSSAPAVVSAVASLAAVQRLTGTTLSPATTAAANQLSTQSGTAERNIALLQTIRQNAILRLRQEQQTLKQIKRLQSFSQQQPKLAISTTVTLASQPRVPIMKRPMTEVNMAQLLKRQKLQQQEQVTGGTLVKTVSAPLSGTSSLTIPVSAVTLGGGVKINVSVPQGKAGAAKAATTITTTQQLRQFLIQQQMLKQARKGNKVTANLTQLAKIPGKATGIPASMNAVQIVQHNPPQVGGTQQVKGLPTAIGLQQIQQAMKQVIPQNLPVVVVTAATPSLPGVHQTTSGDLGSVKAQTTTLPSTTLTTSGGLKGAPPVGVGQQQTAVILQQVAASIAAGLTPVTLAVQQAAPRLQLAATQSPSILSATDQPSPQL